MSSSIQDEYIKKESLHGAQNYTPLSVVLSKGKGAYLWDVDGNKYLDMVSAYSAVSHGHSHPELVKTIKEQSGKLAITSRAFYTEPFANFLESLTKISGLVAETFSSSNLAIRFTMMTKNFLVSKTICLNPIETSFTMRIFILTIAGGYKACNQISPLNLIGAFER